MHKPAKYEAKIQNFAFSKAKTLCHFPWNTSNLVRGRSLLWMVYHENARRPWLFFLVTRSHKMTMCAGFVFLIFFGISYAHLNVGQTSKNPVDHLKTPTKPRWASPNPKARLWQLDQIL
jgi:hypothetical protein